MIGAEAGFWKSDSGNENSTDLGGGYSIDHKAFEECGAAVRAGYLVTPQFQRKRLVGPVGETLVYDRYRADGYQVGGGAEYTLTPDSRAPVYVNAQYGLFQLSRQQRPPAPDGGLRCSLQVSDRFYRMRQRRG